MFNLIIMYQLVFVNGCARQKLRILMVWVLTFCCFMLKLESVTIENARVAEPADAHV